MNIALAALAYGALLATHEISDYWLQTDWMAQNKAKDPNALWSHVAVYTAGFLPAMGLLYALGLPLWMVVVSMVLIGLPHAWMDTRKPLDWFCARTKGWRSDNKVAACVARAPGRLAQEYDLPVPADYQVTREFERALTPAEFTVRFHVKIAMDQAYHKACLFVLAVLIGMVG